MHAIIWPLPGDGEETQVRLFSTDEEAVTWAGEHCPAGGWQYSMVAPREDDPYIITLRAAVERVKEICLRSGVVPMPGDDGMRMRAADADRILRILAEAAQ